MRRLILAAWFCLLLFMAHSQRNNIDSLLGNISNEQLFGTCHYFWFLENGSKGGSILMQMADSCFNAKKEISQKLYQLLTDTSKGVIVHYILSNIWFPKGNSQDNFFFNDADVTVEYTYNSLRFFENNHKRMFASEEELALNKRRWTATLKFCCNDCLVNAQ